MVSKKSPRSYSDEFKRDAVRSVETVPAAIEAYLAHSASYYHNPGLVVYRVSP